MKVFPAILSILLFISFSCQKKDIPKNRQTLRLNLSSELTTIDPRKATDLAPHIVMRTLFEGLMRLDSEGKAQPALAEAVEVSADGMTFTFHLRKSHWPNKDPMTAHDFVRTYYEILSPLSDSRNAWILYPIKGAKEAKENKRALDTIGIKAIDDRTLVFELEYPVPYFLELTAHTPFCPVHPKSAAYFEQSSNPSDLMCNGPFRLKEWVVNSHLLLEKNPDYWDSKHVKMELVHISVVKDPMTALRMFEQGELDWIGQPLSNLPPDAMEDLRERYTFEKSPIAATCWLVFNTQKAPFDNAHLRKAFNLAIHRKALIEHVLQEDHVPAMGAIPHCVRAGEDYFKDADIEAAKFHFEEALKELDIPKEDLNITFDYSLSDINHRLGQALQHQWFKTFGIQVKLHCQEWKVHLSKMVGGDYQIARTAWFGDYNDPISFLDLFKYQSNGTNYPRWKNDSFTQLLEKALWAVDIDHRTTLLKKAEGVLMEDMPISPIFFYHYNYLKTPNLKGYNVNKIGEVDFKTAYFEENRD